jgi:shikimate dehydrogenase
MSQHTTGHTKLLCLLGSPVAHSISPEMHNEACALLDLDYHYLAFDVPAERLDVAVNGLKEMGVAGFNLTMPDKNRMAELCDELSPAAQICGAVNTVVNDTGRLIGHTTDGIGYMLSARDAGCDLTGKRMVQLGAGGAGTAVLVQAAIDGLASIDVFNTRDAFWPRVERIVKQLNERTQCHVTLHDLADLKDLRGCVAQADLLLNTTPVGMSKIPGCLIPDSSYFHPGLVVSDVIYDPKETQLLRMAREAGLKTFNGLYMLLYQGAAAFELWTGEKMPTEAIKEKYFKQ